MTDLDVEGLLKALSGEKSTLVRTTIGSIAILLILVQFFSVVANGSPAKWCYYVAFSLVVLAGLTALLIVVGPWRRRARS